MYGNEEIKLKRNVEGFLIPSGEKVKLLKNEKASITQALGGTYTLLINGNLVQIAGEDADAIGKKKEVADFSDHQDEHSIVSEELIWSQLRTCYDPEIPVNIVDLGLIYDCQIAPLEKGGSHVEIKMTLTAPGCGMGDIIAGEAQRKIEALPGVTSVNVELVWEPLWNRDMITEAARLQLGLL